jgi:hypothetical protein
MVFHVLDGAADSLAGAHASHPCGGTLAKKRRLAAVQQCIANSGGL